jgi:hypothetical protein
MYPLGTQSENTTSCALSSPDENRPKSINYSSYRSTELGPPRTPLTDLANSQCDMTVDQPLLKHYQSRLSIPTHHSTNCQGIDAVHITSTNQS